MIRAATNHDAPRIRELVFSVLRAYGLQPDPAATDADLQDIEANYHHRGGYFAVLQDESGAVVGSYGLYRLSADVCELRKMYLDPTCRGKGLGKQMLEDALARAKQMGFKRMVLETASVLREAISLYRKYGFVPCRAEHLSSRCDQAFEKELT